MKKLVIIFIILLTSGICSAQTIKADHIKTDGGTIHGNSANALAVDTTNAVASIKLLKHKIDSLGALISAGGLQPSDTITFLQTIYKARKSIDSLALLIGGGGNQPAPIPNDSLAHSTISGISLGDNMALLSAGFGLTGGAYYGNTGRTFRLDSATVALYFPRRSDTIPGANYPYSSNPKGYLVNPVTNGQLSNSSITINGIPVSLGNSVTVTASTPDSLKAGYGVLMTAFHGQKDTVNVDSAYFATVHKLLLRVAIADTSAMLSHYLLGSTASSLYATITNLALKINIADTSGMLSNYLRSGGASATYLAKTDTAPMLSPYALKSMVAVTYATITNLALKVNIADTSGMLNNYLLKTLAASTYATIANLALKVNTADSGTAYTTPYTTSLKQPQLNGTGFVRATGTTISYDNSTYITGNQNITLSGDVSGSGTTTITTVIGALKVVGSMIANATVDLVTKITGILPIANGGTNASADSVARYNLSLSTDIDVYRLLGCNLKTQTVGHTISDMTGTAQIASGTVAYMLLKPVATGTVLTGATIYIGVSANAIILASGNCRLALCTYSAGNYTRVDSTANDSTIFKGSTAAFVSKNFVSTYTTVDNTPLYLAFIYKAAGAVTTSPTVGCATSVTNVNALTSLFTNSAEIYGSITSQSFIVSPQATSGTTPVANEPWGGAY